MPWVRLDEGFAKHPKVALAGPLGIALQVAGLCYCNEYLTDGFVPRAVVPSLLNLEGLGMNMWQGEMVGGGDDAAWELVVDDVVKAGLWDPAPGGFRIHDYHKYQPSKADVLAERKQKSEAGRLGGQRSAQARRKISTGQETASPSPNEAPATANGVAPADTPAQAESKPVPVPVTEEQRNPPLQGVSSAPRTSSQPQTSLRDAWANFVNGLGWDDVTHEDAIREELERIRRHPRITGHLSDKDALAQWRSARAARYPEKELA